MLVYIRIYQSTTLNNKNLRKGVGKTKQEQKKTERNPNQIKIKTMKEIIFSVITEKKESDKNISLKTNMQF